MSSSENVLGEFSIAPRKFKQLAVVLNEFQSVSFQELNIQKKNERVNRALLELIQQEPTPCFLLPAVLEFVEHINRLKLLEGYAFYHFELWLNQFSLLNMTDNQKIRSKIVGKSVPRDAYQALFPIGMDKCYPGSHYVTGHSSPDLDTTVASFWGWVDAFGARVAQGLHVWNLPGGPPLSQVEIGFLFLDLFGPSVFNHLPKTRTSLSLSGIDLLSQEGVLRKQVHISNLSIEHEQAQQAVILMDQEGCYLGDWRSDDVEEVRQVINLLNGCLRWFENHLHVKLVALFAKKDLSVRDVPLFVQSVLGMIIKDCEPAQEFSAKQKGLLQDYILKILHVEKGLSCSFKEFAVAMHSLSLFDFREFVSLIENLEQSSLFNGSGLLIENRTAIFGFLEKIISSLDRAIYSMRLYVERLDVALQIKTDVFGWLPQHVSYRADVDEILSKIGNLPYVTVTAPDQDKLIPLGVIYASDLHQKTLGTVTLRDFCNREETKIPSYFEVISVIDHHKSSLQTFAASMVLISDAQSSNVLCAEMAFAMNDSYGSGGMSREQIEAQLKAINKNRSLGSQRRLMQRLLQRLSAVETDRGYFIDPAREYYEYLHFLYAILDDTDLLTKMTSRDVECVVSLLNRMKSLSLQKEVEVISLDDLPRDKEFVSQASERILKNPEMYSLYRKVYEQKEALVNENCHKASQGEASSLFDDTKEQNGCNRVGQTKIFTSNYAVFEKLAPQLREIWYQNASQFYKDRSEVDVHLHMISTVAGADQLFQKGSSSSSDHHRDELWIWIPFTEQSIEHLKSFLNAFQKLPQWTGHMPCVELFGERAHEYERIFNESFLPISKKIVQKGIPLAVLKYPKGLLNSRKAMISPYLPRLIK